LGCCISDNEPSASRKCGEYLTFLWQFVVVNIQVALHLQEGACPDQKPLSVHVRFSSPTSIWPSGQR
jgi:hypothetical protein